MLIKDWFQSVNNWFFHKTFARRSAGCRGSWTGNFVKRRPERGSIRKRWLFSYFVVLIVPMAAFLLVTIYTRKIIMGEIVQTSLLTNKTIQGTIDEYLTQGTQIAANIVRDRRFRDIILKTNSWQDIVHQQEKFIDLLVNYGDTGLGIDILIYVPEIDYIFTSGTANTLPRLYGAMRYLGYRYIEEEQWRDQLTTQSGQSRFVSTSCLSYNEFGQDSITFCANTKQAYFSNCFYTGIFITIPYKNIEKVIKGNSDSSILILDTGGSPVYSFGMDVPDIKVNTEAGAGSYQIIRYLADEYICTYQKSNAGPFFYAMLTRKTSFWNRYNAAERISVITIALAFIVGLIMSVYLLQINYRPVRSVLNIFDKKIPGGGQNEFDIIREQVLSLINARNKMESDLARQDRFLRENILHGALTRNRQFLSNDDLAESIGLDFNGRSLVPVSVLPSNIEQSHLGFTVQDPYTETVPLLLDRALKDLAEGDFDFFKTNVEQTTVFVFFIRPDRKEDFYHRVQFIMEELRDFFQKKYSLVLDVVIGNEAQSIDMLFPRYQEMRAAHLVGCISGEHRVIRTTLPRYPAGNGSLLTDEYVQLLQEAIDYHCRDDALRITNDYLSRLGESGYPFHILRYYVYAFVSTLIDMVPPSPWDSGNLNLHDALDAITASGNQTQLRQSLWMFINLLYTDVPDTGRENEGIFPKVDKFINEHYTDVNLSLTMIADSVGLSVKYISKLFKMETGQGLLSYIGAVRIQKAKELLNEGRYTLSEISEMVGYTSIKTFRRVFQKIEGVNPGKYRNRA
ncbi:MAG: helix-turn-helix transcriptional regulator [Treponema sp.]|jgi:AraC-like DNA-binding protein|nr:helix-turn-helix transcriptional regulator [Treponema sp.]